MMDHGIVPRGGRETVIDGSRSGRQIRLALLGEAHFTPVVLL